LNKFNEIKAYKTKGVSFLDHPVGLNGAYTACIMFT